MNFWLLDRSDRVPGVAGRGAGEPVRARLDPIGPRPTRQRPPPRPPLERMQLERPTFDHTR